MVIVTCVGVHIPSVAGPAVVSSLEVEPLTDHTNHSCYTVQIEETLWLLSTGNVVEA